MSDRHIALLVLTALCIGGPVILWYWVTGFVKDREQKRIIEEAATALGLTDRGEVRPLLDQNGVEVHMRHEYCRTPVRIGLLGEGPVRYCWQCRTIVDTLGGGPGPGGGLPVPKESERSTTPHLRRVA